MTNNPTIDGVSRNALEQALLAMKRIYQAGYDRILEAGGQCDTPEYMMAGDPTARELRALLDAPAVERQDLVTFPRDLTDDMAEAIALRANCCGGIADGVWEGLVQCVEKPKHPDINVCGSWPVQSEPRPRISELQSTIAQLQTRLQGLESSQVMGGGVYTILKTV